MEYVRGSPFPGSARTWAELAPLADALLLALAQIHAAGVIHRDLKPQNVLVRDDGRIAVLDFGVAAGAPLGSTVTGSADVVGTPAYLAPEQIHRDVPVDLRADLHAVGVMLYEVLAGRRPFEGRSTHEALLARLTREAPLLEGVPPEVAAVIHRMLARSPGDRPADAEEVRAALAGAASSRALPWLGTRAPIDALVAAAMAGVSVDVVGPPGLGRTRVLAEATTELEALGRRVIALAPADRPYGSLIPLLGPPAGPDPAAGARNGLAAALRAGVIVVADTPSRLDGWTARLLDRARSSGVVVQGHDAAGSRSDAPEVGGSAERRVVTLQPLAEADLLDLFHGPDRVLHLREDAARLLHQVSAGVPARATEAVRRWVAAAQAQWVDGRLKLERRALDALCSNPRAVVGTRAAPALSPPLAELLAWITLANPTATLGLLVAVTGLARWEVEIELDALMESGAARIDGAGRIEPLLPSGALAAWSEPKRAQAHEAIARALPLWAPERHLHFVAAGDAERALGAAVTFARSLIDTGGAGRAFAALQMALGEARAADIAASPEALASLTRAALIDGSPAALREARRTVERATSATEGLARLLAGWEAAVERRYPDALAAVEPLAPFSDEELEAFRVGLPVRIAIATDLGLAERLLSHDWAGGPLERRRAEWLAHLRFRQGRQAEAAKLHEAAAAEEPGPARRANALVNAGLAWRDAGHLEEALRAFGAARELAEGARLAALEGHARVGERSVRYRRGELDTPDLELVDALRSLAQPALLASACLVEAAVAWRAGHPEAGSLADEAAEAWDHPVTRGGRLLARALGAAVRGDEDTAREVLLQVEGAPALVVIQVYALARHAGVEVAAERVVGELAGISRERLPERLMVAMPAELGSWEHE
jgi:tetratricopeptide (TPR) repeat protein